MRKPWFRIIDVVENCGRSIADIAAEVAQEYSVHTNVMRSPLKLAHIVEARDIALARIRRERPDLSSRVVAEYFRRDSSAIRHSWRRNGVHRAPA